MDSIKPLSHCNSFWGELIPSRLCSLLLPRLSSLLVRDVGGVAPDKGFVTISSHPFCLYGRETSLLWLSSIISTLFLLRPLSPLLSVAREMTESHLLTPNKGPELSMVSAAVGNLPREPYQVIVCSLVHQHSRETACGGSGIKNITYICLISFLQQTNDVGTIVPI